MNDEMNATATTRHFSQLFSKLYLTSEAYASVCWVAIGSVNGLSLFLCHLLLIQISTYDLWYLG